MTWFDVPKKPHFYCILLVLARRAFCRPNFPRPHRFLNPPDAVREARAFIASGETSQTATNNAAKTAYKIFNAVRRSKSVSDADRASLADVFKDLGQAVYTAAYTEGQAAQPRSLRQRQ